MTPPPRANTPTSSAGLPWVIVVLIVLCCGVEAILVLGDQGLLETPRLRYTAYEYGGFWSGLLGPWQPNYPAQPYVMFFSYAFFHSGPVHLVVNMITLYSLGRVVHDRVGPLGFSAVYTAAVLGGGLGFGLLSQTPQPMVGASGGLFGLAGAILAWSYVDRFTAAQHLWPVARAALGLLLLNLLLWWLMDGLLAWQTHLGGFVAGWVTALLVDPRGQTDADNQPPSA